jgi:hypothetical protein
VWLCDSSNGALEGPDISEVRTVGIDCLDLSVALVSVVVVILDSLTLELLRGADIGLVRRLLLMDERARLLRLLLEVGLTDTRNVVGLVEG